MFSMTTIESSTTRPMATVMAPSVMILSVISSWFKTSSAINNDNGIEMTEINVDLISLRNKRMITTAKIAPKIALLSIVSTDSVIGSA